MRTRGLSLVRMRRSIGGDSEYVRTSRSPIAVARRVARRAAAAAELAICLPLIVFLLLASLEACSMIFLDHSLTIASYEGVRMGINYDGTNADVIARCNQIINDRGVEGRHHHDQSRQRRRPSTAAIASRSPSPPLAIPNAILPLWFYDGRTLSCSTTMVKE